MPSPSRRPPRGSSGAKRDDIPLVCWLALLVLVGYPGVAWGVFQFRHPTANGSVFWSHLPTVLSFGTVEEFRPKPSP